MSALAKDLIQRLLMKDPKKRLGCGPRDADEIKEHLFFQVKVIEQIYALLFSLFNILGEMSEHGLF